MKRILLSFVMLFAMAFTNLINAQCGIGTPSIYATSTRSTADSCFIKFSLSFQMKNNNGNEIIGIDLWKSSNYSARVLDKVPSVADLTNSLGSIVIDNKTSTGTSIVYYNSYPSDGKSGTKARLLKVGAGTKTLVSDSFNFDLQDIEIGVKKLTDGSCDVATLTVQGDVWSSNAGSFNASTKVHCYSGIFFSLGNPVIASASGICGSVGTQKSLNFRVETSSPSNITVTYKIFKDDNFFNTDNKRVFDVNNDVEVTLDGTQPITDLRVDNAFVANSIGFTGADVQGSAAYWIVVYYTPQAGQSYSVNRLVDMSCATLPVSFKSFTATKGSSAVALKWTTASESNNKGFYVQRYANGQWENVMFVATKAINGNSQSDLNYTATDNAKISGTVQYRILQVDIDGKSKYSEIRALKGDNVAGSLLVYPNPASHGNVFIVLENANASYNIQVIDGAGRIVKQFTNVRSAQQISGLPRGQYIAKVIDSQSGESSVEKFIMQ